MKRFLVRVPFLSGLNSRFDWFGRVEWEPPRWATLARVLPLNRMILSYRRLS